MRSQGAWISRRFTGALRRFFTRPRRPVPDQSWYYHPEMQARLTQAEADIREGRYQTFTTREELFAHLDSLKARKTAG